MLLAALPVAYVWQPGSVVPKVERGVLLWNRGYEHMDFSALEGMAYRLLALGIATVLGIAFLAAVPRGRAWYTALGTRTMYVYLLHGLVVKTLDYGGVLDGHFFQTLHLLLLVTAGGLSPDSCSPPCPSSALPTGPSSPRAMATQAIAWRDIRSTYDLRV